MGVWEVCLVIPVSAFFRHRLTRPHRTSIVRSILSRLPLPQFRARDREMQWLRSIGIKGIKVDFFGGDKQETLQPNGGLILCR